MSAAALSTTCTVEFGLGNLAGTFQRHFLCCRRFSAFPWHTILHPLCQKYPPSQQYRKQFLLELIKKYESTGADPLDELYDVLAEVLNAEETYKCHKSYLLPSGDSVTLIENVAIISEGTTGLVTWEAALSLAEWSIENKVYFKNRSILELGSGAGLTGLVICKSCSPRKYMFSDCHSRVLQQLRDNIQLNGYSLNTEQENQTNILKEIGNEKKTAISVIELNWELVTEQQLQNLQADVIIASDVAYDPEIIVSFSKVLRKLFNCFKDGRNLEVFVSSTIRNSETYNLFKKTLDIEGLMWQVVPDHKKIFFPYDTHCKIEMLNIALKVK
ncbi:hypothetical protein GDO86_019655 [Hymenochirus boettgeri]|uniref:FAM86 N-terminal domain-containing protein n=1 Tax=Hymenochirus boettgeri TaxID=247094 RepID=A0A8T2IGH6_9PIPI|nr:hypothetical protein GDO86_019655 [Hymenochirus boettgeri]